MFSDSEIIAGITAIGIMFAFFGGINAIRAARRRRTLDILLERQSNDFYREITSVFFQNMSPPRGLAYNKDIPPEIKDSIHSFLNYHEMIAIGIYDGALDETMCKRYMKISLTTDFKKAKQYIDGLRRESGNDNICIEFERLSQRWEQGRNFQKLHKRIIG